MSYFKDLIKKGDDSKMVALTNVLDQHFIELETVDPKIYWETMNNIYELLIGNVFDEESVLYAVSCMINEDGTTGEHWTMEQTNSYAISENYTGDVFDWYYVMNMMYSDYCNIFDDKLSIYVSLTKAWLADKDAQPDKAYNYWKKIIKGH